jgi:hypothetical protein
LRLRRAERGSPQARELVTVRTHLEHEMGEAVSRSLAARLLGVSHTALQRWIEAGDVPLVPTRDGKLGVPVPVVLDLHEAIRAARKDRNRRLHVIEPAMTDARARAEALDAKSLVPYNELPDPHDRAERRNRAYHAAVARHLRKDKVRRALHQLWRWEEEGTIHPRYANAWEDVLKRPLADVKAVLTEDSQWARDLRQNSPFAGALSEPERRKILAEIR